MQTRFEETYSQRYSFLMPDKRLVIEAVSIEAIGQSAQQALAGAELPEPPGKDPVPQATVALYSNGRHHDTPVSQRDTLHPGAQPQGPHIYYNPRAPPIF